MTNQQASKYEPIIRHLVKHTEYASSFIRADTPESDALMDIHHSVLALGQSRDHFIETVNALIAPTIAFYSELEALDDLYNIEERKLLEQRVVASLLHVVCETRLFLTLLNGDSDCASRLRESLATLGNAIFTCMNEDCSATHHLRDFTILQDYAPRDTEDDDGAEYTSYEDAVDALVETANRQLVIYGASPAVFTDLTQLRRAICILVDFWQLDPSLKGRWNHVISSNRELDHQQKTRLVFH